MQDVVSSDHEVKWPDKLCNGTGKNVVMLRVLLDAAASTFRLNAIFDDDYAAEKLALWGASTQVFQEAASVNPTLLIRADGEGSGKTTLMALLSHYVRNGQIKGDPSDAVFYRSAGKKSPNARPTFIIDEADEGLFADERRAAKFLNLAYTPETSNVSRSGKAEDDYEEQQFSLWQPYVLTMIGQPPKATTRRRLVVINLRVADIPELEAEGIVSKPGEKKTSKEVLKEVGEGIQGLLHECADYLRDAWPELPPPVRDASIRDNWRLMLAIADLAGGHWPATARAAMQAQGRLISEEAADLLTVAVDWFDGRKAELVPTQELLQAYEGAGFEVPAFRGGQHAWITARMKEHGIPNVQRPTGPDGKRRRGFERAAVERARD